jgi:phenylacetic acid degradation operon negative regulatory protein
MSATKVSDSLPVRTQFVFFTFLGDYILPNGGKIWTGDMLYLMNLLDISERAVRSTLSRMTRKGWISPEKHGRRSQYTITPRGRALLESGYARIFEPSFTDWDQTWHLVVYSLPEKKREIRHELRKQLTWLGFGRLESGTWISPHNRQAELKSLFSELKIEAFVEQFSGAHLGPSSSLKLAKRCWNLQELETAYQDFVGRYAPKYEQYISQVMKSQCPKPEECFIQRFWITHEFQALPLKDPNLPTELLPPDWIGSTARDLVSDYRKLLGLYANQFVRDVINGKEHPSE